MDDDVAARWVPVPALAVAIAVLLASGVAAAVVRSGDDDTRGAPAPPPSTVPPPAGVTAAPSMPTSIVAQAIVPAVAVYPSPPNTGAGAQPALALANPQPTGAPLVFLVLEQQPEWLRVLLPTAPNGSTGWIRRSDVSLSQHDFAVVVELAAHRVTVFKGGTVVLQEPVGIGTGVATTPPGLYYIKELLQPPNRDTVYGPYAFGLSGFSNLLTSPGGNEGVVGLHGTNDPSSLGTDGSAGHIRMSNAGVSQLARTLPLGVPLEIRP